MKDIIKEIIPSKISFETNQNKKILKRKLNIYNLKNGTNYSLEELGIVVISGDIFYYYKRINEKFDYNKLDVYRENYFKAFQIIEENLKGCDIVKRKPNSTTIIFLKNGKYILKQDLRDKYFYLANEIIWNKISWDIGYSWVETSRLCDFILQEKLNQNGYKSLNDLWDNGTKIEEEYKKGEFINI